jgi:hypothetical protein
MKSTPRDQVATISFGARCADVPSGSGVAQPGAIPFTYTRTAAGQYAYRFDARILALAVLANADYQIANQAATALAASGTFALVTYNNNVPTSAPHTWTCTALDKRT